MAKEMGGMLVHPSLTAERIAAAVTRRLQSLDNPGFCISCGEDHDGCEPDAREYECEHCGEFQVYGADELYLMVVFGKGEANFPFSGSF